MVKVKLGLKNLSVLKKITKANAIVNQMTGNPNFTNPNPSLANMSAKISELESAKVQTEVIKKQYHTQVNLQKKVQTELDSMIKQLASYVNNASTGDSKKILSSGFAVAAKPGMVRELYPPEDFIAKTGDEEGEVNLSWKKLRRVGNHTYHAFGRKYGSQEKFKLLAGTDQKKVAIKGLESSGKYELYVLGVKENVPGPPSETVVVKAG
ncbi:MAG: hypothetical protein ISS16_01570 [Ignavibacteria bacterium]|nr:hypothetical protein [Ignavibacteria bacterium]